MMPGPGRARADKSGPCSAPEDTADASSSDLVDVAAERDHGALVSEKSDARFMYHMASYAARKRGFELQMLRLLCSSSDIP